MKEDNISFDKDMMAKAISLAKKGSKSKHGGPFGAVITKDNKIIGQAYNKVGLTSDCTQHAELRAIQESCKNIQSASLKGSVLYTSCEPCMMCLGAAKWAELDKIYYGATAEDAKKHGFVYSNMFYASDAEKRHQEFKMIQLSREDAVKVWEEN